MSPRKKTVDLDYVRGVLIDTAQDAMFQSDREGRLQWVNRHCAELLGYDDSKDLVGMPGRELYVTPRVHDRMMREVQAKGHVANFVAQLKRRDGRRRVMEMNVSLLRDRGGQAAGIVGIGRDVTRRVAAQKTRRRKYEFNQRVLDTIPASVFAVDLSGRIVWVNGAACRHGAAKPSTLVGTNIFHDAPAWMRHRAEDIREVMTRGQMRTLRRERIVIDASDTRHITFTIVPTREMGEISGAIIEGIDVTETVELYTQMLQAERRFRALFDSAPEVYLSFDPDGTVVDCNETAREALGYEREEIIGRPLHEMYMPEDQDKADATLKAGAADPCVRARMRLRNSRGKAVACELTARVLRDETGQTVAAFAVHQLGRRRRQGASG